MFIELETPQGDLSSKSYLTTADKKQISTRLNELKFNSHHSDYGFLEQEICEEFNISHDQMLSIKQEFNY